jgi:hypothetical protein
MNQKLSLFFFCLSSFSPFFFLSRQAGASTEILVVSLKGVSEKANKLPSACTRFCAASLLKEKIQKKKKKKKKKKIFV